MKFVFLSLIIMFSLQLQADNNNINLYKEFNTLYYQGKEKKALKVAEKYLKIVDDNPNLGDLAALYLRLSDKNMQIYESIEFLLKIVKNKKDYITKERIILAIADYFFKKEKYYSALTYYRWIERNHNVKSLVYDDSLWNSYLIYKKVYAYNAAIKYLDKIINTHEYAIYVGSYNQFHIYDAYIEKSKLLIKQKKYKKAVENLKKFLKNFSVNDQIDDAYYLLCTPPLNLKENCCKLIEKRKFSSYYNKAKKVCDEFSN